MTRRGQSEPFCSVVGSAARRRVKAETVACAPKRWWNRREGHLGEKQWWLAKNCDRRKRSKNRQIDPHPPRCLGSLATGRTLPGNSLKMAAEKEASHANVIASMFENLSKCLTDNAALLRELHARGLSGAMPGPSSAVPGPSAAVEAPSSTKKRKADETPKPKQIRTLSAYMLFSAAERDAVKAAHPELKSSEIMGELGRRWKQLASTAKKPFEDKAAQLKQENMAAQDKVRSRAPSVLRPLCLLYASVAPASLPPRPTPSLPAQLPLPAALPLPLPAPLPHPLPPPPPLRALRCRPRAASRSRPRRA
jgi:hypothetical protein